MSDASLMDANCLHGITWYDCDECGRADPSENDFQVRTIRGELRMFTTWEEASKWARANDGWKLSFSHNGERLRFVRDGHVWVYQDIYGHS